MRTACLNTIQFSQKVLAGIHYGISPPRRMCYKINKFDKLFKFPKGLEHSNSSNEELLCNIELIPSCKPNAFCNVGYFYLSTFLIKSPTLEKSLKRGKTLFWWKTHKNVMTYSSMKLSFNQDTNLCLKAEDICHPSCDSRKLEVKLG